MTVKELRPVAVKELRPIGEKQPNKPKHKTTSLEYWSDEATRLPVDVKDFEIWTAPEFGCNLYQSDKDLLDEISY